MHIRRTSATLLAIAATCVLQAGCGGSDLGDGGLLDQGADNVDSADPFDSDDDTSMLGEPTVGALDAGPVTVSAEPGHAVVTVDGRTIDHTPAESGGSFTCVFTDDQINLEVRSDFGSMILRATRTDDGWLGTFTADSDEDGWIQYSAQPFDGELGIDFDSDTLSYVGAAVRQDRDAMSEGDFDTPTVDVTVAINCGGDPARVEVGDQTFTFPLFESTSMTCLVAAPDSIDIVLNSLATQNRQLQFSLRPDGEGVIGGVYIIDGDDRWNAIISTNDGSADGLSFDGSTVTFTGTFVHTSDADPDLSEEFDGTATVTCPS